MAASLRPVVLLLVLVGTVQSVARWRATESAAKAFDIISNEKFIADVLCEGQVVEETGEVMAGESRCFETKQSLLALTFNKRALVKFINNSECAANMTIQVNLASTALVHVINNTNFRLNSTIQQNAESRAHFIVKDNKAGMDFTSFLNNLAEVKTLYNFNNNVYTSASVKSEKTEETDVYIGFADNRYTQGVFSYESARGGSTVLLAERISYGNITNTVKMVDDTKARMRTVKARDTTVTSRYDGATDSDILDEVHDCTTCRLGASFMNMDDVDIKHAVKNSNNIGLNTEFSDLKDSTILSRLTDTSDVSGSKYSIKNIENTDIVLELARTQRSSVTFDIESVQDSTVQLNLVKNEKSSFLVNVLKASKVKLTVDASQNKDFDVTLNLQENTQNEITLRLTDSSQGKITLIGAKNNYNRITLILGNSVGCEFNGTFSDNVNNRIRLMGISNMNGKVYFIKDKSANEYPSAYFNNNKDNVYVAFDAPYKWTDWKFPTVSLLTGGIFDKFAVASDNRECSEIGKNIFKAGGSVTDAALATMICAGVMNSHSNGIGGGFFFINYDRAKKEATTFDSREVAPALATRAKYQEINFNGVGSFAIGVPGEVAGYGAIHKKFGQLPWPSIWQPTIDMCERGYKVSYALARAMELTHKKAQAVSQRTANWMMNPTTGVLYKQNDQMKCSNELIKTFKTIQRDGAESFYQNTELSRNIIADIVDTTQKYNGTFMTVQDLMNYSPKPRPPLHVALSNGDNFYSLRPPSSGAVLGYILNILAAFNFSKDDVASLDASVRTYHRFIETYKFAYAQRSKMGDEDYVPNLSALLSQLADGKTAEEVRRNISDSSVLPPDFYGGDFTTKPDFGTSHLSLIAENGDAVSMTSTINTNFGSLVMGERTGIIFNNEMDDFSIQEFNAFGYPQSPSNFLEPGKRPMSSMSPTIITDANGDAKIVIGAQGGSKIITSVAYVTARMIFFGETPLEATEALRVHHQLRPNEVNYENNYPQIILDALAKKGHILSKSPIDPYAFGVVQSLLRKDGKIYANSDWRKAGYADGE